MNSLNRKGKCKWYLLTLIGLRSMEEEVESAALSVAVSVCEFKDVGTESSTDGLS